MLSNDFATLMNRPRRLVVGGATYRVFPLTIGDLGRLQEFVDGRAIDPESAIRAAAARFRPHHRRWLVGPGLARARRRRPLIGTPEAGEVIYSVSGLAEVLFLAVRKGRRGFSRAAAGRLYWEAGPGLVSLASWAIWGAEPDASPSTSESEEAPESVNVHGLIHNLAGEPHGYPMDAISRMTLAQVRCVLAEKAERPRPAGVKIQSMLQWEEMMAHRKADPWAFD